MDFKKQGLSVVNVNTAGPASEALISVKSTVILAAIFSGVINILQLSSPLFMLQIYDRVIPSHSIDTLQALILLILLIYTLHAALETIRSRVFARIGAYLDIRLSGLTFAANIKSGLVSDANTAGSPFRDLENLRNFLSSGGLSAFFDIPWTPIFLILLFVLHPYLGALGLLGCFLLIATAIATNRATRPLQGFYPVTTDTFE